MFREDTKPILRWVDGKQGRTSTLFFCVSFCFLASSRRLLPVFHRVETQRKQYHRYTQAKEEGKTGSFAYAIGMDDENRIAKLNEIGFSWTVRGGGKKAKLEPTPEDKTKPLSWNERFEQLKAYKEENGDCLVPNNYEPNKKLGIW